MRRITSRPAVRWILSGFCLFLVGTLGCATDELGPGGDFPYAVWFAQRVSGTVLNAETRAPIPGATVIMSFGFELTELLTLMTIATTTPTGSFSFVRAEETGVPGDFWRLGAENTRPQTVYIRLQVQHGEYQPSSPILTLSRTPSKNPPTTSLFAYSLTITVPMTPAPDE